MPNRSDHPTQDTATGQVAGYIGVSADGPALDQLPASSMGDVLDLQGAGAPADSVSEVQTLTIDGTPTGGTFKLRLAGLATAAITWTDVDATLVANIDAALEALAEIGADGVDTAAGTVASGIGTVTMTFTEAIGPQPLIAVDANDLTGTSPTLAVDLTTPGVAGTGGGQAGPGARYTDTDAGNLYLNGGSKVRPVWKLVTRDA